MKWWHKKRLKKLADFLKTLHHKKFNFGLIINDCGTVGCAWGWTPVVFPKHLKWHNNFVIFKDENLDDDFWFHEKAAYFFGITTDEALGLFSPGNQYHIGLPNLFDATPKQVAKNIETFLSRS